MWTDFPSICSQFTDNDPIWMQQICSSFVQTFQKPDNLVKFAERPRFEATWRTPSMKQECRPRLFQIGFEVSLAALPFAKSEGPERRRDADKIRFLVETGPELKISG